MAIVDVTKDLEFPEPGQKITLTATLATEGNDVRFRVSSVPIGSTIEVWDEGKQNWLPSPGGTSSSPCVTATFTPDVKGIYYIDAVEELVTAKVPTFSNDGGPGEYVGIEQRTAVGSPESSILCVGTILTRTLGFPPHTCELTLKNGVDTSSLITSGADGVVTYYGDQLKCPMLSNPSDSIANMAMRADTVGLAVAAIGGKHGIYRYGGTSKTIAWESVIDDDPMTSIAWLNLMINSHIRTLKMWVHSADDTVNVVTAPDPTVGDAASQVTSINDIRTQLLNHFGTTSSVHQVADAISGTGVGAALAGGATLTQRLERANQINIAYNAHRELVYQAAYQPSLFATVVHGIAGDGSGDDANPSATARATDEAELVSLLVTLKSAYESHRLLNALCGGISPDYHVNVGGADNTDEDPIPTDPISYTRKVNSLLDVLGDHVLNIKHSDGSAETYHTIPDYDARTDSLPRAADGDMTTAIALHEMLVWLFMKHIRAADSVHSINTNQGQWVTEQSGVGDIHEAFHGAVVTTTATVVPPNELPSEYGLIHLGGFTPV